MVVWYIWKALEKENQSDLIEGLCAFGQKRGKKKKRQTSEVRDSRKKTSGVWDHRLEEVLSGCALTLALVSVLVGDFG